MTLTTAELQLVFESLQKHNYSVMRTLQSLKFSAHSFYEAVRKNPQAQQYLESMQQALVEGYRDDILEIADDDSEATSRSELRIKTRQWLMSKTVPEKYGEKMQINTTHSVDLAGILDKFHAAEQRVLEAKYRTIEPLKIEEPAKDQLKDILGEST